MPSVASGAPAGSDSAQARARPCARRPSAWAHGSRGPRSPPCARVHFETRPAEGPRDLRGLQDAEAVIRLVRQLERVGSRTPNLRTCSSPLCIALWSRVRNSAGYGASATFEGGAASARDAADTIRIARRPSATRLHGTRPGATIALGGPSSTERMLISAVYAPSARGALRVLRRGAWRPERPGGGTDPAVTTRSTQRCSPRAVRPPRVCDVVRRGRELPADRTARGVHTRRCARRPVCSRARSRRARGLTWSGACGEGCEPAIPCRVCRLGKPQSAADRGQATHAGRWTS